MEGDKRLADELSYPILLAERVILAAEEAESFKIECGEVAKQANRLADMIRHVVRSTSLIQSLYERPIRRVASESAKNLERALTLVRRCRHHSVFYRLFSITSAADFRKLSAQLDGSIGDLKWILRIYDTENSGFIGGGGVGGLPPIATNDPILSWVWSYIAFIYLGELRSRIDSANGLASLARDNDRNKGMIVEEGGVVPLLKLLKEGSSPEAQIAAIHALYNLSDDEDRVRRVVNEGGVSIIVNVLNESVMRVQIEAARLVARMVERSLIAQEDFAREHVIRPLVTLLAIEISEDDSPLFLSGKQTIPSIVQINKQIEKHSVSDGSTSYHNRPFKSYPSMYSDGGSSRGVQNRRERENESPELKHQLKMNCAEALWKISRGSVPNSRRITETKGLLCLAKLVEKENGELQYNCLMTLMEITAAAESNADLRRAAFKTNSPAAKAVVDQLLRVIKELDSPMLQVPAIRSIGSLAKTFPIKEKRVIKPLVGQLSNKDEEVVVEAAIALQKFACPENFLCVEHSKAIIDFNGVQTCMSLLLRGGESMQLQTLILLCYLAIHAGNDQALEEVKLLTNLESIDSAMIARYPELRELVDRAIYQLNLYKSGGNHANVVFP
ncbi:hypothetical protein ACFE04_025223 [Oxalis oulophora]